MYWRCSWYCEGGKLKAMITCSRRASKGISFPASAIKVAGTRRSFHCSTTVVHIISVHHITRMSSGPSKPCQVTGDKAFRRHSADARWPFCNPAQAESSAAVQLVTAEKTSEFPCLHLLQQSQGWSGINEKRSDVRTSVCNCSMKCSCFIVRGTMFQSGAVVSREAGCNFRWFQMKDYNSKWQISSRQYTSVGTDRTWARVIASGSSKTMMSLVSKRIEIFRGNPVLSTPKMNATKRFGLFDTATSTNDAPQELPE